MIQDVNEDGHLKHIRRFCGLCNGAFYSPHGDPECFCPECIHAHYGRGKTSRNICAPQCADSESDINKAGDRT
jgi:hypothetical protein